MMVTQVDLSNDDWEHASAIVRDIVSRKPGGIILRSRLLSCVMVNATMAVADITFNTLDYDPRSLRVEEKFKSPKNCS
jgi:hypothetical protein